MNLIETYTGLKFNPIDPDPDEIMVSDIAHALSHKCRYTGHCWAFYSVAQHSVLVSNIVPDEFALDGLLHDAAEAYLPDVAFPIKHNFPKLVEIEDNMHRVIATKFGLTYPYPPEVTDVDRRITIDESRSFMASKGLWWHHDIEDGFFEHDIQPMTSEQAKQKFLERFYELVHVRVLQ